MPAVQNRAYVAAHFAMELDDKSEVIGFCKSVEGGNVKAEILTYQMGSNMDLWRQIGKAKYDDISLAVGMSMAPRFYDWIADFFSRNVTRRNGAIVGADFNYAEKARRTFTNALINEVQMPGLDGASKDPVYMTVKISPETVSFDPGTGNKIQCPPGLRQPSKLWLAANFDFTIDGMDDACSRVTKIDGFSIKQKILEHQVGYQYFPLRVPGNLEIPNITIYVPQVDAGAFIDAVKSRVQQYGDKPEGNGLTGAITLLGSDKSTLCTINLFGIDITSYEPEKFEAQSENMARCKIQLQVESMRFNYASMGIFG